MVKYSAIDDTTVHNLTVVNFQITPWYTLKTVYWFTV